MAIGIYTTFQKLTIFPVASGLATTDLSAWVYAMQQSCVDTYAAMAVGQSLCRRPVLRDRFKPAPTGGVMATAY